MVMMNVWPTDAADGSVANEARWRKMGRVWTPSGVVRGAGGELMPTLMTFPTLAVRSGAAWVDGHYCELPGDQVFTITANGLLVVRFDPAANTAELVWRDGATVPAQNPTGTWELAIASTTGSVLTDWRSRWANGTPTVAGTGFPGVPGSPVMPDAAYLAALTARTPWLSPVFQITAGWGSGLRQVGTTALPAIPATFPGSIRYVVSVNWLATGAAGSGAPLAGSTLRTRFRVDPGIDQGISGLRTATSDQQIIDDMLTLSFGPGSPAHNLEVWAETSAACNIGGAGFVIGNGGGAL